jgi:hypothetical protein
MKIISGGQTGVDRAALDAALEFGIPAGGWCPRGRKAEDGPLDAKYPLKETDSDDYSVRTERNVCDSDGTLIITRGRPTGGTAYTIAMARVHNKPCLVVDLDEHHPRDQCHPRESGDLPLPLGEGRGEGAVPRILSWLLANNIITLNIAGPRESNCPGIYTEARKIIADLLKDDSTVSPSGL